MFTTLYVKIWFDSGWPWCNGWDSYVYIYILQVCINEFPCLCMNYTTMKLVFDRC